MEGTLQQSVIGQTFFPFISPPSRQQWTIGEVKLYIWFDSNIKTNYRRDAIISFKEEARKGKWIIKIQWKMKSIHCFTIAVETRDQ